MTMTSIVPPNALRPYVREFIVVETETPFESTVLPDTGVVAGFRFRGAGKMRDGENTIDLPRFVVSGLRDTKRNILHTPGGILLTAFTAGGASAFFREPLHLLYNHSIPLDCLVPGRTLRPLEDTLMDGDTPLVRAHAMARFLIQNLRQNTPDPDVLHALNVIEGRSGDVRIEDVARGVGLSQSALERRFRSAVGASPKRFASTIRFRSVIQRHKAGERLGEIAHDLGYYDQPHLVRDFHRFAGESPSAFFARPQLW